jgi:hypothetical protein
VLTPQERSGVVAAGIAAVLWTAAVVLVAVTGGGGPNIGIAVIALAAIAASVHSAWTLKTAARTTAVGRVALAALVLWSGFVVLTLTHLGPPWTEAALGGTAAVALAASAVATLVASHRRRD